MTTNLFVSFAFHIYIVKGFSMMSLKSISQSLERSTYLTDITKIELTALEMVSKNDILK